MKHCNKCDTTKPFTEFNKNKAKKDGLSTVCSECNRKNLQEHYKQNKPYYLNKNIKTRQRMYQQMLEWLSQQQCVDCGENDIIVLQFDHLFDKSFDVAKRVGLGYTWKTILEKEVIPKCEIVCANCHTRRTHQRLNSQRHQWGVV